ncbi:MAG: hypothetical protein ACFFCS_12835 [Candidatus Hodarchaeota archaeon]
MRINRNSDKYKLSIMIILMGISFFIIVLPKINKNPAILANSDISTSQHDWSQIRLDGRNIGCFNAYGCDDIFTKYPEIISALTYRGANVTQINISMMPIAADLLANYDVIWFDGTSGSQLSVSEIDALETWVNDSSGGILATDGDSSSTTDDLLERFGQDWALGGGVSGTTTNIYGHEITQNVSSIYYNILYYGTYSPPAVRCVVTNSFPWNVVCAMESSLGKLVWVADGIFNNHLSASNYMLINNTFGWLAHRNNNAPELTSEGHSPGSGNQDTLFNFSVVYTDLDNNEPFYVNITIDGFSHAMQKAVPTDYYYDDGCVYYYTGYLQPGILDYNMTCSDGDNTNTTTTSSIMVTLSNSQGPEIQNASVSPATGNNLTNYNFSAKYIDVDNNFPADMDVIINGSSFPMVEIDPYDDNVMDGKWYQYLTTLDYGLYQFQVYAFDGTSSNSTSLILEPEVNPFLVYGSSTSYFNLISPLNNTWEFNGNINFTWESLDDTADPMNYTWQFSDDPTFASTLNETTLILETPGTTTYEQLVNYTNGQYYWRVRPEFKGMVGNWIDYHVLDIVHNDFAPELTAGNVNPSTGNQSALYNFTVLYTDQDNNAPFSINVSINGTSYQMEKSNGADSDYNDGCVYNYTTYLTPGPVTYSFECNDGRFSNSTSTYSNLTVTYTNGNNPTLTNATVSPTFGNNVTVYNFTANYTDPDNNYASNINLTINGTGTYTMVEVDPLDINVMDGKFYYFNTTILAYGYYQFQVNCSDGVNQNATSWIPGPEVSPFFGYSGIEKVAIIQNKLPWYNIIETILTANTISYDVYTSAELFNTSFSGYDKIIIPSSQDETLYSDITSPMGRSLLESYVAAGGILEYHGAQSTWVGSLTGLPGGYNSSYWSNNALTINASYASHEIVQGVTSSGIDNWGTSAHNHFGNLNGDEKIIIYDDNVNEFKRLFTRRYGEGLMIFHGLAIEHAAYWGDGDSYQLLQNMLLYSELHNRTAMLYNPYNRSHSFNGLINFSFYRLGENLSSVTYEWEFSDDPTFASTLNSLASAPETYPQVNITRNINYSTGLYYWRARPVYQGLRANWPLYFVLNLTQNDNAPTLTVDQVDPPTGGESTLFNFSVVYTDTDDNYPLSINLTINGSVYTMSKADPGDTNYVDGCVYNYSTILPLGTYNYNFTCFDGIFTNTTSNQTLVVALTSTQPPSLTNYTFTPTIGDNLTIFNFTVNYTDIDNNKPTAINITINGTKHNMTEANASDTYVIDGKIYYWNGTIPTFGIAQVEINAFDGFNASSTGLLAGPELNVFEGYMNTGKINTVAIFRYEIPFGLPSDQNEVVLTANGITYVIYPYYRLYNVIFEDYDKVILPGDQDDYYFWENYVEAYRHRLEDYVRSGGIVQINNVFNNHGGLLPFGYRVSYASANGLAINQSFANHPLLQGVDPADFDGYTPIANRYYWNLDDNAEVLVRDNITGNPLMVVAEHGNGLLIMSEITVENAYYTGINTALLENMILYGRRGPRLILPRNESLQYNGNVNFTWAGLEAEFGPANYTFELADNVDFNSSTIISDIAETPGNMSLVQSLSVAGTYYWRVRTEYQGIIRPWSNVSQFDLELNDNAPVLSVGEVDPTYGPPSPFYFYFYVTYTDADNNFPVTIQVIINGSVILDMDPLNGSDQDVTDGKDYYENNPFSPGNYTAYFYCFDGVYTDYLGNFTFEVHPANSNPPNLNSPQVTPALGDNTTIFNFTMIYLDTDNNEPVDVNITINSTGTFQMVEADPSDTVYTDGKIYYYETTLPFGSYEFQINGSDFLYASNTSWILGPEVNPFLSAPPVNLTSPVNGSTEGTGSIDFIWESLDMGFPVNYTWQLSNLSNFSIILNETIEIPETPTMTTYNVFLDLPTGTYYWRVRPAYYGLLGNWSKNFTITLTGNIYGPSLSSGQVNPPAGNQSILFTFTVNYTDLDDDQPVYVNVVIDGTPNVMVKQNSGDLNYTDGCIYQFLAYLNPGNYTFFFNTSDGFYTNTTGSYTLNVTEVNLVAPTLTNFGVTPSIGNDLTVFNFSVTYSDGDNNLPDDINVTINGTTYPLVAANASDLNVMDGKVYYYTTTFSTFGNYEFNFNCFDGVYSASTVHVNEPDVDPFYGIPAISLDSPEYSAVVQLGFITFRWSSLSVAFSPTYAVQISTESDFSSINFEHPGVPHTNGTIQVQLHIDLPERAYYWRVVATYQGINGCESAAQLIHLQEAPATGPTFFEQYGLIIIILAVIGGVVVAAIAVVASRKKQKVVTAVQPTQQLPKLKKRPSYTEPGELTGKLAPKKKLLAGKADMGDEKRPMTAEELAELQETEKEVVTFEEKKICVVHKGPIAGAMYMCPKCETLYCMKCARSISTAGEQCWTCGDPLDVEASVTQLAKARFYCADCQEYHEIQKPDMSQWYSCPKCQKLLSYIKSCPFCSNPIMLDRENYELYKGKVIQCSHCNKNSTV